MTARILLAAYGLIAALVAVRAVHNAQNEPEGYRPPKWWMAIDPLSAALWPLGFYIWACNTDMKWASCTTRDGWSEK